MKKALVLLIGLAFSCTVYAIPISFTATDMTAGSPVASVSGSFDYSYDGTIFSLSAFDMTIKNKTYGLADLNFRYNNLNTVLIGEGEPGSIWTNGFDDFWFRFNYNTNTVYGFLFTTLEDSGFWEATTVTTTTTTTSVPEPGSFFLMVLALVGLFAGSHRKARARSEV